MIKEINEQIRAARKVLGKIDILLDFEKRSPRGSGRSGRENCGASASEEAYPSGSPLRTEGP